MLTWSHASSLSAMSSHQPTDDARRLRAVARAHEHGRPGYPIEAVRWLVPGEHKHVLEVGAGVGKLTEQLLGAGHAVHAVDQNPVMLEQLRRRLRHAKVTEGRLEDLSIAHRSIDNVVCSTAFTSFNLDVALPTIARSLKAGGHLSVVWHERDTRIPWVRRLGAFLEGPRGSRDNEPSSTSITEKLMASTLFSYVEHETFTLWQEVNRETVADLVLSRTWVSQLSEVARAEAVEEVRDFYADYGRGMDGMRLPYVVHCVRTQVVHQPGLFDDGSDVLRHLADRRPTRAAGTSQSEDAEGEEKSDAASEETGEAPSATGEAAARTRYDEELFKSDGTDTDMLLIDFH